MDRGSPIIVRVIYIYFFQPILAVAKNVIPTEEKFIVHLDTIYQHISFSYPVHVCAVISRKFHYIEARLRYDAFRLHQKGRFIFNYVLFYRKIRAAPAASFIVPAVEIIAPGSRAEHDVFSLQGFYLAFCHGYYKYGLCHIVKYLNIFFSS